MKPLCTKSSKVGVKIQQERFLPSRSCPHPHIFFATELLLTAPGMVEEVPLAANDLRSLGTLCPPWKHSWGQVSPVSAMPGVHSHLRSGICSGQRWSSAQSRHPRERVSSASSWRSRCSSSASTAWCPWAMAVTSGRWRVPTTSM